MGADKLISAVTPLLANGSLEVTILYCLAEIDSGEQPGCDTQKRFVHIRTGWREVQILWEVKQLSYMFAYCEFSVLPEVEL